ncbi:hypothetical protein PFLUV_G00227500 [Perca fluviatilis]|uniref:Ig-like domain-containing protein n=1 Tax=Perca fluviatilis TaxID=8168 RepID=A0A6A5E698_PERFL|nr:hypothetical protein PFLUV_G00227500 [Perca fluviatilis]
MKLVLLLALLTVSECDSSTVVGRTGEDVTLSCKYDIKRYKALSVCWGRGQIPIEGCNNQLISTDGHKVIEETRVSSRYELLGRLGDGDVSLTILNISETDAGFYGCRVEIPGWFNDDNHQFILIVERAPQTTTSATCTAAHVNATLVSVSAPQTTRSTFTAGPTNLLLPTSSPSSIAAEESSSVYKVLLCVLFGLVALSSLVIAISSSRSTVWSSSAGHRPLCTSRVEVLYACILTGPALLTSRFDISRYSDSDWNNFKLRPLHQVTSRSPQTDPVPLYWTVSFLSSAPSHLVHAPCCLMLTILLVLTSSRPARTSSRTR